MGSLVTRILMVDKSADDVQFINGLLHRTGNGIDLEHSLTALEAVQRIKGGNFDVVLLDCDLGENQGIDLMESIASTNDRLPVILLARRGDDEIAAAAIKRGAADYLVKSRLTPELMRASVRYATYWGEQQRLRRQAEHRFERAFRVSPDAMAVVTFEGRLLDVNDRFVQLTGHPRNAIIGHSWSELALWAIPAQREGAIKAALDHGHVQTIEVSLQDAFGKLHTVLFSAEKIDWEHETCLVAVCKDVTELQKTQESLREREEQLRLILDSTAEAIYGLDMDGKCTFCNPSCLRVLGYSAPEELLGRNMHEVKHQKAMPEPGNSEKECRICAACQQGCPFHGDDAIFLRSDGTRFPAEYWCYPILKNGNVVGSVVTFLNISERKDAEEALRRSEEKYRHMVKQATYGIYHITISGRFLEVNPALVNMLGYGSEQELMEVNMEHICADAALRNARLTKFLDTGVIEPAEFRWIRKDKKLITVRLSGNPIYDDVGIFKYFEVIAEDVTEQRSLEQQLREAQKMEAIGRVAGGVAHDLNNLLMVINGSAEIAMLQCKEEAAVTLMQQILAAGNRAGTLIRQLLAFSRKQVLEPRVLNLNTSINELSRMLPRLLGEDVEIKFVLADDLGLVKADSAQLDHVVMNLVINARDAMPRGGKLVVQTDNLTLDEDCRHPFIPAGEYVTISVRDNGIGMDADTKARIFEPFFTTKEAGKGTGLGLSTVYGIIKQSGGYITVNSEVMQGATFTIYLPRTEALPPMTITNQAGAPQPPMKGSGTVLLVEDETALRKVTAQLLAISGYTVLQSGNPFHALELARSHGGPIHILLTDFVMPGMNGIELASRVRKVRPDIRIIHMSGYSDRVSEVQQFGPDALFLQKPFNAVILSEKIGVAMQAGATAPTGLPQPALAERTGKIQPIFRRLLRI